MQEQQSQSTEPYWAWTDESRLVYEWAARRLAVSRVTGVVADIGCGSGVGTEILMDSGFSAIGIETDQDAIAAANSRVQIENRAYRRDNLRRRNVYGACIIVGIIGWYGHETKIMQTAMRDSGYVLANTIYPESWFNWMGRAPVFSILSDGQTVLEWKR